jgi:hypothetical protein
MKHLTEEELVEQYYAAAAGAADAHADSHLRECATCAAAFAALEVDLAALRPVEIPERDAHYGEQMWARVEAALPPRTPKTAQVSRFAWLRGLSYAGGCAVLAAGAFYGGRIWEQRHPGPVAGSVVAHTAPSPVMAQQPKVVVVVLGDHLDRSERLLVELKHTDRNTDRAELEPMKDEARSLLTANRVFRDDAEREGDPSLSMALDHLDRVLTEIANRPDGLDAAEAARIRDEMNADGLLFEVRVLRSKNPHRTNAVHVIAKAGAA